MKSSKIPVKTVSSPRKKEVADLSRIDNDEESIMEQDTFEVEKRKIATRKKFGRPSTLYGTTRNKRKFHERFVTDSSLFQSESDFSELDDSSVRQNIKKRRKEPTGKLIDSKIELNSLLEEKSSSQSQNILTADSIADKTIDELEDNLELLKEKIRKKRLESKTHRIEPVLVASSDSSVQSEEINDSLRSMKTKRNLSLKSLNRSKADLNLSTVLVASSQEKVGAESSDIEHVNEAIIPESQTSVLSNEVVTSDQDIDVEVLSNSSTIIFQTSPSKPEGNVRDRLKSFAHTKNALNMTALLSQFTQNTQSEEGKKENSPEVDVDQLLDILNASSNQKTVKNSSSNANRFSESDVPSGSPRKSNLFPDEEGPSSSNFADTESNASDVEHDEEIFILNLQSSSMSYNPDHQLTSNKLSKSFPAVVRSSPRKHTYLNAVATPKRGSMSVGSKYQLTASSSDKPTKTSLDGSLPALSNKSVRGTSEKSVRGTPEKSVRGTPNKSVRGTPNKSVRGTPNKSVRGTPNKSVRGTPNKSVRGTPNKSVRGTPNKSVRGTPNKSVRGTPNKSVRGTPEKSVRGTPEKSVRGTPEKSVRGTPEKSVRGTPEKSVRGTPNKSVGGTPNKSVGGTPDKSVGGTPEKSFIRGTPEKSFIRGTPEKSFIRGTSEKSFIRGTPEKSFIRASPRITPEKSVRGTPEKSVRGTPNKSVRGTPNKSVRASPNKSVRASPNKSVRASPNKSVRASPNKSVRASPNKSVRASPNKSVRASPNKSVRVSPNKSVRVSPNKSVRASPNKSVRASPNKSAGASPNKSAGASPDTSAGASPDTSAGASPDTSAGASPDTSAGASPDTSAGASPDTSAGASPDTSAGASPDTSDGASPDTSDGASPDTSAGASPIKSARASPRGTPDKSAKEVSRNLFFSSRSKLSPVISPKKIVKSSSKFERRSAMLNNLQQDWTDNDSVFEENSNSVKIPSAHSVVEESTSKVVTPVVLHDVNSHSSDGTKQTDLSRKGQEKSTKQPTLQEFLQKLEKKQILPRTNPHLPQIRHEVMAEVKRQNEAKTTNKFIKKPVPGSSKPKTKKLWKTYPKSYLKTVMGSYSKKIPGGSVLNAASDVTEAFFKNLFLEASKVSEAANHRCIEGPDILFLMKKQGLIDDNDDGHSLNALVEEYLPMDLWPHRYHGKKYF